MKKLKKAYKKLNVIEYSNIIKNTLVPYFDDYDGEFVTMLSPSTKIEIKPHFYNDIFFGYNIFADNKLLETKETLKKAKKFVKALTANKESFL